MPYTLRAEEAPTAHAVGKGISTLFDLSSQVPHALIVEVVAGIPGMSTTANKYVLLVGDYTLVAGVLAIDCVTYCSSLIAAVTCPTTGGAGAGHSVDLTTTVCTITGVLVETGTIFILGVPVTTL